MRSAKVILCYSVVTLLILTVVTPVAYANHQNHTNYFVGGKSNETGTSTGGRTDIETKIPQAIVSESARHYFWVGSFDMSNYFLQVGYYVDWSSQGVANWFWEVFDPNGNVFDRNLIGASVGPNGEIHRYKLVSSGTTWTFYFDDTSIGSVTTQSSDLDKPNLAALAELSVPYPVSKDAGNQLGPSRHFNALMQWNCTPFCSWTHISSARAHYETLGPQSFDVAEVCPPYGVKGKLQDSSLSFNEIWAGYNIATSPCTAAGATLWN